MVKATPEIKKILSQYVRELAKRNIHPERVILFGSHASGSASDWSDIDISIISKDLEGKGILERQLILGRANQDLQAPLDVIGYSTLEASQCESGTFLYEIIKTGLEIPLSELS
ncbi:MAG: hypothetical protein A2W61_02015 [Deltaproteobacteria bacterium RIFCSPLOWO2_01_44_7]|nr:MAG: hypothetical protein A2712_01670 [Deltaproteobacteria bacterium RIFCSPHIGHO2_01_FULL_43_49]OGQ15320.1 MAG: hypothetical protein A3D22_03805 [Deltaproteobacteria bacterium RIFCSPHIGHO2_02_FULL_44_53]OGQ27375.1 MAG: hypothetical protein A3D98_02265 [Deltaproteobacteria bacterium RIFCSPHIGHO2_12_FULL_44_21]OGQ31836.1 MAG: hypothetical protein A2979_04965 [Deltaproteobacteria bacterium RIFCSPLOWO2_01_FULL_45_74]OGQ38558.1 MAG: hypothetical protein A2W61_02015 [Deltaproteobacteria bacterium 